MRYRLRHRKEEEAGPNSTSKEHWKPLSNFQSMFLNLILNILPSDIVKLRDTVLCPQLDVTELTEGEVDQVEHPSVLWSQALWSLSLITAQHLRPNVEPGAVHANPSLPGWELLVCCFRPGVSTYENKTLLKPILPWKCPGGEGYYHK